MDPQLIDLLSEADTDPEETDSEIRGQLRNCLASSSTTPKTGQKRTRLEQPSESSKKRLTTPKIPWQFQVILAVWTSSWSTFMYKEICKRANEFVMEKKVHLVSQWIALRQVLDQMVCPKFSDAQDPDLMFTPLEHYPITRPCGLSDFEDHSPVVQACTTGCTVLQRKELEQLLKEIVKDAGMSATIASISSTKDALTGTSSNSTLSGAEMDDGHSRYSTALDYKELFYPEPTSMGKISQNIKITGKENVCSLKSPGEVGNLHVEIKISQVSEMLAKPSNERWKCVFRQGNVLTTGPQDPIESTALKLFDLMVQNLKNNPNVEHTIIKKKN